MYELITQWQPFAGYKAHDVPDAITAGLAPDFSEIVQASPEFGKRLSDGYVSTFISCSLEKGSAKINNLDDLRLRLDTFLPSDLKVQGHLTEAIITGNQSDSSSQQLEMDEDGTQNSK